MNNEFDFQSNLTATEKKNKNGYAIASLVLGIVSILSCCCCCSSGLGLIFMGVSAILAIVFAFVSKKNSDGKMDAKAIAGLVLGIVTVVVLLCFAVAIVGTYALIDQMPESEMIAYFDENVNPLLEGNEEAYNAFVESIKAIYGTKNAQ